MCLVVGIGTPTWGIIATDTRHERVYPGGRREYVDRGGKLRPCGSGWASAGGDAPTGLATLKRLRDVDPSDGSAVQAAALAGRQAAHERYPDRLLRPTWTVIVWPTPDGFHVRALTEAGEDVLAGEGRGNGKVYTAWPTGMEEADKERLQARYIELLGEATTPEQLRSATRWVFREAASLTDTVSTTVDGLLLLRDSTGQLVLMPVEPRKADVRV